MRTRVGYAGGTKQDPSYYNLGDHSETVQIDYDPAKISYEKLLDIFWDSHDPTLGTGGRQWMSIIFYHDEEQQSRALESRERQQAERAGIVTEIVPFTSFYIAEQWHQKYHLVGDVELIKEFSALNPVSPQFIDSTAAARVNGYLGGYGSLDVLQESLDGLGFSPAGEKRLLEIVDGWGDRLVKGEACGIGGIG